MTYSARVLLDSVSPAGARLVTMEWTYPRFIHAEVMRTDQIGIVVKLRHANAPAVLVTPRRATPRRLPVMQSQRTMPSTDSAPCTKTCKKCGQDRPLEVFGPERRARDGLAYWCRECKATLQRSINRRNGKAERPKRTPGLIEVGLKECLNCRQVFRLDELPKTTRGLEGRSAYCDPCHRVRFHNREVAVRATRQYRATNPGYTARNRAYSQRRRAMKQAADDGDVTTDFMVALYSYDQCVYCGAVTPESDRTVDHVIPLARGGRHARANLVMACRTCNVSKRTMTGDEFMEKRRGILG